MILEVKDLEAKVAETGQTILRGVNLTIREGEVRGRYNLLIIAILAFNIWNHIRCCYLTFDGA